MSPGATMERVYLELKARIMAVEFAPGSRLDPAQLARSLAASATPVRDALHRLSGERLIDSWHHEGFRQPILTEADLHDLYRWTALLLDLALRASASSDPPLVADPALPSAGYASDLSRLVRQVALMSDDRELRFAIASAMERSEAFRSLELRVDPVCADAVAAMDEDLRYRRLSALRAKLTRFHRRRMSLAGRLVVELRPRTPPLRE